MVRTGTDRSTQDARAGDDGAPWRIRVLVGGHDGSPAGGARAPGDAGHRRRPVAGAAVLLADGLAVTCAHVVEAALRRPRTEEPPAGTLEVDFPTAPPGTPPVPARVAEGGWFRRAPAGDLAVLRLAGPPPPGTAPAPVTAAAPETGAPVLVFGHPADVPDGVWASAHPVASGGPQPHWLQLDGDGQGARIERGFSGAGVWDRRARAVYGVVSSVLDRAAPVPTRVAWMVPFALLAGTPYAAPADDGGTGPPADPPPGPPAGPWDVVNSLLATGAAAPDGGRGLLSLLPDRISGGVPREDRPRLQIYHLVRRCGDFTDGPRELVRAVRELEGDTLSVRRFAEQARRLWPDRLTGADIDGADHA
ncbi:effector-associated domain 2-containing protein [Streptomyces sp. HMX87]|uniref:effector-associated domain 2-containing protein n=1 Tax=Streptomyces sp. HMX87 TaxID=3390849 RepID=UPI003A8867F7